MCSNKHIFAGGSQRFYKCGNTIYAWGNNYYGQLGLGHECNVTKPAQVLTLEGVNIIDISSGYSHTLFLSDEEESLCVWR